jgi:cell division protein FtsA
MVIKDLPMDAIVSQNMVNELMDSNRNMTYPDYEIQDAITEEYKVDLQYQNDPVGIQASRLEGNFLNILWRRSFYRNLNKSFDNAGIAIAETYLAPLVMADNVLTEAEKRAGCVLVDLGAETTTVSVYYRDKLRSIAVIPLGGDNITKDLESLQMEACEAERMKLKYSSAITDVADIDPTAILPIDSNRSVESRRFIEVVEARTLEIIENVKSFIPSEYIDKLLGGIIITGGGSNMTNIEKAFREITGVEKIRIAKFVTLNINSKDSKPELRHDGTMNTILSLIARGDMNCAGNPFGNSLFDNQQFNAAFTTGTTNDTSCMPSRYMWLTALPPPPPTPITLIIVLFSFSGVQKSTIILLLLSGIVLICFIRCFQVLRAIVQIASVSQRIGVLVSSSCAPLLPWLCVFLLLV